MNKLSSQETELSLKSLLTQVIYSAVTVSTPTPLCTLNYMCVCVSVCEQLQQQQSRLMKINHDLRHKISVVEAQGKALIEQKVELEAGAQARGQEVGALRQEVTRLRERLQGDQNPEETPPQPPSPAEVTWDAVRGLYRV